MVFLQPQPLAVKPVALPKTPRPLSTQFAGVIRSRDEAQLDSPSIDASSKSAKRVKFDMDSTILTPPASSSERDWPTNQDFIRNEVSLAIDERLARGNENVYQEVINIFKTSLDPDEIPPPAVRHKYTVALIGQASRLSKTCSQLVSAVLQSDWIGRDDDYVNLFYTFLSSLVTVQGVWVPTVLNRLARNLAFLPPLAGQIPGLPLVSRRTMFERVHNILRRLLRLIPSASTHLVSILPKIYPSHEESTYHYVRFVQNLLHLTTYAPELRSDILFLITERIVKIDVHVQDDIDDLTEDAGDSLVSELAQTPLVDYLSEPQGLDRQEEDVENSDEEEDLDEEAERLKVVKANVAKVDAVLDLLFHFYQEWFDAPSASGLLTYEVLFSHFSAVILPTFRSRHVQFLIFRFAQKRPELIQKFFAACMQVIFDNGRSAPHKQAATAYLGSFVARGSSVTSQMVRDLFLALLQRLEQMRASQEKLCVGPDPRRYNTMYSMFQAILYIFCFRWRDLVMNPEDALGDHLNNIPFLDRKIYWFPDARDTLSRLIYSKFNPLKVCSQSIVGEFARIAHHVGFMYVHTKIDQNKRLHLSSFLASSTSPAQKYMSRDTALTNRRDDHAHQLEAYFPFDPYRLPRSKHWVDSVYVEWQGVPGLDDEDEDVDEAEETEDVDEEISDSELDD